MSNTAYIRIFKGLQTTASPFIIPGNARRNSRGTRHVYGAYAFECVEAVSAAERKYKAKHLTGKNPQGLLSGCAVFLYIQVTATT